MQAVRVPYVVGCMDCGRWMHIVSKIGQGQMKDGYILIECETRGCVAKGLLFKFPLEAIDVEEVNLGPKELT